MGDGMQRWCSYLAPDRWSCPEPAESGSDRCAEHRHAQSAKHVAPVSDEKPPEVEMVGGILMEREPIAETPFPYTGAAALLGCPYWADGQHCFAVWVPPRLPPVEITKRCACGKEVKPG